MKTRKSFVTNSSSSSFIVDKKYLSPVQIGAIKDHKAFAAREFGWSDEWINFSWDIDDIGSEEYGSISGSVSMNNFSMYDFMDKIGIDMDKVKFRD
jgi:hypothetical protein